MAHLDAMATPSDAKGGPNWDALFWWRRDNACADSPAMALVERLHTLSDRTAPASLDGEAPLPGNRMRANAARFRIIGSISQVAVPANDQIEPEMLEAIRAERHNAVLAVGMGSLATAMAAGTAAYAAAMQQMLVFGFAAAGMVATSFALYHAARWLMLMRSDAVPKFI